MSTSTQKQEKRIRRHRRIRAKIVGTAERPRLAVFRSNRGLYAQLIDDEKGVTLLALDTRTAEGDGARARARAVGVSIAKKAGEMGITKVLFDRGGFLYAGTISELAEGARSGGLQF